jgi:hypothetical protein
MKPLGELVRVPLREYWPHEAHNFTRWLGDDANLKLLAETIGLGELEVVEEEYPVGDFRADILAKNSEEKYVVIENQLEESDHKHLGQIITYSSGLGAAYVVWVAPKIREDHRKAIDWLNSATIGTVKFFALEFELWRIGSSEAAPKFNIVCQPNIWEARMKASVAGQNPIYAEFWEGFLEFCKHGNTDPKLTQNPIPTEPWYKIKLDTPKIWIELKIPTRSANLTCQLVLDNSQSKRDFESLEGDRRQIDSELGGEVEWSRPVEGDRRHKVLRILHGNIQDRDKWKDYFAWLKDQAETFYKVFHGRIKVLHLNENEEQA